MTSTTPARAVGATATAPTTPAADFTLHPGDSNGATLDATIGLLGPPGSATPPIGDTAAGHGAGEYKSGLADAGNRATIVSAAAEFDPAGRRVAVTGAAGFIGQALCRRLSADGAEVTLRLPLAAIRLEGGADGR